MSKRQQRSNKHVHPRKLSGKRMRESFMIYCEGETEVGYFGEFRKRAKCLASGNALAIVRDAVDHKKFMEKNADQYWIVFDKDNTSNEHFDLAIKLAKDNGIHVAWSNQCFELWFILHFRGLKHACNRSDYAQLLRKYLPLYNPNDKGLEQGRKLYVQTSHLLKNAIINAQDGYLSFNSGEPESKKESSTLIYELVREIIKNS